MTRLLLVLAAPVVALAALPLAARIAHAVQVSL